MKHGGAREGAGRPATGRRKAARVYLSLEHEAELTAYRDHVGVESLSQAAAHALSNPELFGAWKASKTGRAEIARHLGQLGRS